jgi:hypothetical protein
MQVEGWRIASVGVSLRNAVSVPVKQVSLNVVMGWVELEDFGEMWSYAEEWLVQLRRVLW